jgi:hypothetical protein
MPEVEYDRPLGTGARKRHYHKTERGQVVDFVVQLEIKVEGRWMVVIRYDCTHGFVHRDRYDLRGEKRKGKLDLSYKEGLALADTDINENWERYKEQFLKGGHP